MKALYIGRFQPLHKAHVRVINDILKKCDHVIIAIGSAKESKVYDNPFTAGERKMMINRSLKAAGVTDFSVAFVPDIPDDNKWTRWVEELVGKFDVVYTGNKHTWDLFKKAKKKVVKIKLYSGYSSTKVRKWIVEDKEWKKLVPEGTVKVIKNVKGVARIKKLAK